MFSHFFRRVRVPSATTLAQRPRLWALEDRTAPAVNSWLGGNADWTADPATNWSLGRLPDGTDDVQIANGATVTHGANGTTGGDQTLSISVTGDSTLVLSGGSITDSTTLSDVGGSFRLSGGTLIGATVPAGSTITGTTESTLSGLTIAGTLDLQSGITILHVTGGLSLPGGLIRLGNAGGSTFGQLRFSGASQTVDGTAADPGTILFGANQSNGLVANDTNGSPVVTYGPHLTVTGATGTISNNFGSFDLQGTVAADPAAVGQAAGTITLDGSNGTSWTNTGTILAQNGGTIRAQGTTTNFSAGTLTGGTWKVFANSTLQLVGGNITANAADIVLDGANSNFFSDSGGTTDALANLATNAAAGSFTVRNGRNFTPSGTFTNSGLVNIGANSTFTLTNGGASTGPWTVAATATLDFVGTGETWNLNTGSTVTGDGTVRFRAGTVNFADTYSVNNTVIEGPFTVGAAAANFNANSNTSTLDLDNTLGGTLGGSGNFTITGLFTWNKGTMKGPGTTFANGGISLDGGTLDGRRLDNAGTATWPSDSGGIGLGLHNGAVFNNNGVFDNQVNATIDSTAAEGAFINNGTFRKSVVAGTTAIRVPFTNTGTLDVQTGTVSLDGPRGGLTNFPIASTAAIGVTGATESGTTVTITTPGGHAFVVVGQTVTISGVAEAGYNGTFTVTAVPSQSTFQYTATTSGLPNSGGGAATFLSTSTLTGGTYLVSGTLQFTGADIVTNAANIVLNGPASAILNSGGFPAATDALANFATNAAGGSFTIQNGRNFTTAGSFSNAGSVTVGSGSTFSVGGGTNYTQAAGTTTVNGTLVGSLVNLSGGVLSGTGTVNADLSNAAVAAPGQPLGTLHVTGNYTQTAAGTLSLELAGTNAADFDRLVVGGTATLNGTVGVALTNGFHPALGDSFPVLSFGSRTGDFSTRTGFVLGNAVFLGEQFGNTSLTLNTNRASLQYQTQPADTPAGQSFPVVVRVVDAGGNVLAFDSIDQVTLTLNQNSFAGGATSVTRPVVNGVASFTLTIDQGATGYRLTAGANGFVGVDSNTFTIQQPAAISPTGQATFTVGTAGNFKVTASGVPAPTLTVSPSPPGGLTFTDNHDGTATLAGTPAANTGGTYPLTITAHNGAGPDVTQAFTLTVNQAPAITSLVAATFTVGSAGSFPVAATGFPTPALTATGDVPDGVTLTDNHNGTATLTGTPAAGTGRIHSFTITAHNGVGADATQTFTLTVNERPAITSPDHIVLVEGASNPFTVRTSGFPRPTLSRSGTLPDGVSFNNNGDGTATLSGAPLPGTSRTYTLTITAHNGIGPDATQTFTLTVAPAPQAPAVTSADHATFTVGSPGSFTVVATGAPTPTVTVTGAGPDGVTLTLQGGTATLAGTPAAGSGRTYPFTITAANGVGSPATQTLTLTVNEAPAITVTGTPTFVVGSAGSVTVTATGFPTPALTAVGLPDGVTLTDHGNGTGTLVGTPTAGTGRAYTVTITAANGVGAGASQTFTLTVNEPPAVASGNAATFVVGVAETVTVTATGFPAPTLSALGTLPDGVTFHGGSGSGTLAGTPAAGSTGVYPLTIIAHNGIGADAAQTFALTVAGAPQAPTITSADHATFAVGSAGSFTIQATGAPTPAVTVGGAPPAGVTLTDRGAGTVTLAGTPAAGTAGVYSFTITAHNGTGADAAQTFTLTVVPAPQAPAITSGAAATFAVGSAGSFSVTAAGSPTPTLALAGSLPAGVTFAAHGDGTATLGGVPAAGAGGTYTLTVTAANGVGAGATQTLTLTVNEAPANGPPAFTSPPLPTAMTSGVPVSLRLTATGNPAPTFSLLSGQLPPGLTLDPATGAITGTPTTPGTFTGTLRAANTAGVADQPFAVTVPTAAGRRPGAGQNDSPQFVISGGTSVVPLNPDGSAFGTPVGPVGTATTRAVLADVTGDGVPDLVVGSGPGAPALVLVIDGASRQTVMTLTPFEDNFTGGTFVAAGDVDGDGRADVAVSADTTGGTRVVVFGGATGAVLASFFGIEDPAFRNGTRAAMGDVNGDGLADLAVSAGPGGGPRVALFDGASLRPGGAPAHLVGDFFAFEPALRDGAFVTIGDMDGDGFGDLVAGAGSGGSPRVLVISGRGLLAAGGAAVATPVASFFAGDPALRDGARVAAKDLDGDRLADLVVAVPAPVGRQVLAFRGVDLGAGGQTPVFEDYSTAFDPLLSAVFVG